MSDQKGNVSNHGGSATASLQCIAMLSLSPYCLVWLFKVVVLGVSPASVISWIVYQCLYFVIIRMLWFAAITIVMHEPYSQ